MSIDTARMTSSIAETSWNMIFAPSRTTVTTSKQLQQNDSIVWLWTALGLSVFGLKLCNDALEFYRFFAAWNRVWRRRNRLRGGPEDDFEPTKDSLDRRKEQIEKSLITLTFGELQKRFFAIGTRNKRNDNEKIETKNNHTANQLQRIETNTKTTTTTTTTTFTVTNTVTSNKTTLPSSPMPNQMEKMCVICFEEFETNDLVTCSKTALESNASCRHFFHKECLEAWLVKHSSCPTCRHRMLPEPDPRPWLSTNHR